MGNSSPCNGEVAAKPPEGLTFGNSSPCNGEVAAKPPEGLTFEKFLPM